MLVLPAPSFCLAFRPLIHPRLYIGNDLAPCSARTICADCGALGLDQPLWERFGHWFQRVRSGMGNRMLFNMPAASVIRGTFCDVIRASARCFPLLSGVLGVTLLLADVFHRWPDKMICRISYYVTSAYSSG
ncbi:hypothetical protein KCP73_23965 [Salmonella enterica subsp. enterica]|nr:hypothetical protein KCP73_23965 [Salmonella enterica subsp. enterica]